MNIFTHNSPNTPSPLGFPDQAFRHLLGSHDEELRGTFWWSLWMTQKRTGVCNIRFLSFQCLRNKQENHAWNKIFCVFCYHEHSCWKLWCFQTSQRTQRSHSRLRAKACDFCVSQGLWSLQAPGKVGDFVKEKQRQKRTNTPEKTQKFYLGTQKTQKFYCVLP